MRAADLAVLVSHREGLPVNVKEAMATGLPLVVSDCRGSRELVSDWVNGRIVGGRVEDTSRAIIDLLTDADLAHRYGMKGRERVQAYGAGPVKEAMSEIYRSVGSFSPRK
ncbi:hypothetical protein GCM10027418_25270 [Mariniluteicoccus endophyticus]